MALLIHCYNVVIAAPRRLLGALPRPRLHLIPGKRTARRAAAGKAAASKTIIVCTVTSAGLGGLGYGAYRALAGNGPGNISGSGDGGARFASGGGGEFVPPFPLENLLIDTTGIGTKFPSDIDLTALVSEITVPPIETTTPVPEPSSLWLLGISLFLLGVVQWHMNRGKKSAG